MALETLAEIKRIAGFDVVHLAENQDQVLRSSDFVVVNHVDNSIRFYVQKGPIAEVGRNRCQVDTIVMAARLIIEGFNAKMPCRENSLAITKLQEAEHWLKARYGDRVERGVEGTNKP